MRLVHLLRHRCLQQVLASSVPEVQKKWGARAAAGRESNSTQAWPEEAEKPWSEYEKGAIACQARPVRASLRGTLRGTGRCPSVVNAQLTQMRRFGQHKTRANELWAARPRALLAGRPGRPRRSQPRGPSTGRPLPGFTSRAREIPPAGRRLLRLGDLTLWCVLENARAAKLSGFESLSPSAKSLSIQGLSARWRMGRIRRIGV